MSQIQVRDTSGHPIPRINIRIAEGTKPTDEAIFDVFTDLAGNSGWPIPFWPQKDFTLWVNDRNVDPRFHPTSLFVPAQQGGDLRIVLEPTVPPPGPVDPDALRRMPRYGMSIAALIVCRKANIAETVKRFQDVGVRQTRINLTSALWTNPSVVDVLPFRQRPDGIWALDDWDPEYDDRVDEVTDRMNGAGIRITYTLWEDYSYSNRRGFVKVGVRDPDVPDGNQHPYRKNDQGFRWGGLYNGDIHEDDETLGAGQFDGSPLAIPNAWAKRFMARTLPKLHLDYNILEIGNEQPEKSLHRRVKEAARAIVPGCFLQVNRQNDSPGQYPNMKIGRDYDFIAFHGNRLRRVADLDRRWEDETVYPTMRTLLDDSSIDKGRIIFSSDGARISSDPLNPYEWSTLKPFIQELAGRGISYDHQSRAKLTGFPNHDLIEGDWYRSLGLPT